MKQELLFAMAIVNKPDLLVLDESFNGLDPTSMIKVRKILLDFKEEGKTILISSHNLSELDQMTSHIIFLKDGRIIEEDISKYQEDIYIIDTENTEDCLEKINDSEFKLVGSRIHVSSRKYKIDEIIKKISEFDRILDIRKEVRGVEERYKELYKD